MHLIFKKGVHIAKKVSFVILAVFLLYLEVSTILFDSGLVGRFGYGFAAMNRELFGYLSFLYLFLLIYPLYKFMFHPKNSGSVWEKGVAYALAFFSLLLLQALIIESDLSGKAAQLVIETLKPYLGSAGVWFFWFLISAVAAVLLYERKEEISQIKSYKETARKNIRKQPIKDRSAKRAVSQTKNVKEDRSTSSAPPEKKEEPPSEETEGAETSDGEKEQNRPSLITEISGTKIVNELEENKKLLDSVERGGMEKPDNFMLPSVDFLKRPPNKKSGVNEAEIDKKIKELMEKLSKFKIEGDVVRTYTGPVVTTFEFKPAPHIKVSKIQNLQDDLAMALKAKTIRIQAPVPGKDVVGIEIPNKEIETIYLREILESDIFKEASSPLTIALGKDIVGKPFVTDLKKLPHLLIAGTTGSGKSVGINSIIVSLLYRNSPENLKLMLIDPKMLEFSIYDEIPHLLTPVITKSKQAITALNNMVSEMERRYQLMSKTKTKNIEGYNKKAKKEGFEPLPYIVVTIDELADLMMTSGKEVEYSIARLAQMARASGIHLIVATQRPSVDVVTGLIKANLPSRISFKVGQRIDSKVILDSFGAESLLGRGDMLFTPPGVSGLIRLHAPWISESEIEKIVEFLKSQREPEYDDRFLKEESGSSLEGEGDSAELDELFEEAREIVLKERKSSISYLQRRLQIGYNRAARIVEQLEMMGVLSPPNSKGNREILV